MEKRDYSDFSNKTILGKFAYLQILLSQVLAYPLKNLFQFVYQRKRLKGNSLIILPDRIAFCPWETVLNGCKFVSALQPEVFYFRLYGQKLGIFGPVHGILALVDFPWNYLLWASMALKFRGVYSISTFNDFYRLFLSDRLSWILMDLYRVHKSMTDFYRLLF